MNRHTHRFRFVGQQIAEACAANVEYHDSRVAFWVKERSDAIDACKTAGFTVKEYTVTGGTRAEMVVDPTLQRRVDEAVNKIATHQAARDRFRVEAGAYGAQPTRDYELDPDDVVYFRLAGGNREE